MHHARYPNVIVFSDSVGSFHGVPQSGEKCVEEARQVSPTHGAPPSLLPIICMKLSAGHKPPRSVRF